MKHCRSQVKEGRDNMLMQGIKRWLHSLFAWWPWKRAEGMNYEQTIGPLNRGTTSETLFRPAADGPFAQPTGQNIITISIEPSEDDDDVEWPSFESRDSTAPLTPPTSPTFFMPPVSPFPLEDDEAPLSFRELYEHQQVAPISKASYGERKKADKQEAQMQHVFEPATQQRLEFLRYLIQRGIVSDDIP